MILAVVSILVVVLGGIAGGVEVKYEELSALEDQLKELDSGLDKALDIVSMLKSEFPGKTFSQDGPVDLTPLRACLRPLEAWRTEVSAGQKFTMTYREISDNVTITWMDTATVLQASYAELSGKVMESSVTLPNSLKPDSMILMTATCGDKGNGQSFEFWVNEATSAHQVLSEDPMPVVELNVTGDVVYHPGEDAVFKITSNQPDHPSGMTAQMEVYSSLVDLQTGEFEMRSLKHNANTFVEILDVKSDVNSSEATVRMKMAERMKSGIIKVSLYKSLNGNVVFFLIEYSIIFVRPSNQTGPFPPGYMHIAVSPHAQKEEDGKTIASCSINKTCSITCEAFGEDVESVDFIRVNPDGLRVALEPGPLISRNAANSKYSMLNTISLMVDESSNTDVTYICVATSRLGKQAFHYFAVKPYIPVKIIPEKSSIFSENGELNITCTATGRPQPNITFQAVTSGGEWYYAYDPDTVSHLGNDAYAATKLIDYDQATMGKLALVSCTATGVKGTIDEMYDYFNFVIPSSLN